MYAPGRVTLLEPRYDRPPEGLARGRWEAPRWAILLLGALVVAGAVAYLVLRARRRRALAERSPVSGRGRGARAASEPPVRR